MSAIPTRHPDKPGPVPAPVRLLATALGVGAPSAAQWQRLGRQLTAGDEPMAALVEWMTTAGSATTRPLFDRILVEGIAGVPDAPEPLRRFFAEFEPIPTWVDPAMIVRGQRALRRCGADGMYIARDVSLMGGYQFSSFNMTLIRTGTLEKGSNKRFAETMQWAMDVIADDGLTLRGSGYRATLRVRLIHEYVRRYVAELPDWRAGDWGLPVNQTDMAATLVGALVAPPVGALGLGVVLSPASWRRSRI